MNAARMNRRDFVRATALAAGAFSAGAWARSERVASVELMVRADRLGSWIAPGFAGLSYESAQLRDPQFFAGENTQLIGFFRRLGYGVLRLGGNTSEYCYWAGSPSGSASPAPAPARAAASISKDRATPMGFAFTGQKTPAPVQITPDAIRHLRDFLDATGWSLIYGLNMGTGAPEKAAAEAAFVGDVMGSKLLAFQLANEPDLFSRNGIRDSNYGFPQFAAEWERFFEAVRARVPQAPFAGPDSASNLSWPVQFARELQGKITLLTHHYYAEGPPTDPRMTIERLLSPDPRLSRLLQQMREIAVPAQPAISGAAASGPLWRLAETNSCYQGGKPGVSDTFASALWAADLMFQVAAQGASGINFHGGGYGWYTPIAGNLKDGFSARPEYHGMLLFAQAAAGRFVEAEIQPSNSVPLLSAYAARGDASALKLVLVNKDAQRRAHVSIDGTSARSASILRLLASRLEATSGVNFGGSPVGTAGAWAPAREESSSIANGIFEVEIPAGSAALITCQ